MLDFSKLTYLSKRFIIPTRFEQYFIFNTVLSTQIHADVGLRPRIEHGAVHLFNMLKYINNVQLTRKEREIVYKKLQINSYYGHPESVLLASVGKFLEHLIL